MSQTRSSWSSSSINSSTCISSNSEGEKQHLKQRKLTLEAKVKLKHFRQLPSTGQVMPEVFKFILLNRSKSVYPHFCSDFLIFRQSLYSGSRYLQQSMAVPVSLMQSAPSIRTYLERKPFHGSWLPAHLAVWIKKSFSHKFLRKISTLARIHSHLDLLHHFLNNIKNIYILYIYNVCMGALSLRWKKYRRKRRVT